MSEVQNQLSTEREYKIARPMSKQLHWFPILRKRTCFWNVTRFDKSFRIYTYMLIYRVKNTLYRFRCTYEKKKRSNMMEQNSWANSSKMRCELCFFNTRTMVKTLVTPFKSIPHSSIRRYVTVSSVTVSFWSINSTSWGAQIPLMAQNNE